MNIAKIHLTAAIARDMLDLSTVAKRWEREDAEIQYREACFGPEFDDEPASQHEARRAREEAMGEARADARW